MRSKGSTYFPLLHVMFYSQLLADVEPGEETALYFYLVGALLTDKSANEELTAVEKETAERAFEESRLHWLHNSHAHRTDRMLLWSCVREICYLLKTQPQKAPRPDLAPDAADINRATELLTNVERSILPTCPAVIKTILLLAAADCYMYRNQPFKGNRRQFFHPSTTMILTCSLKWVKT